MDAAVKRIGPLNPPKAPDSSYPIRLERGEIIELPTCPFPLPEGDDMEFLRSQRLGSAAHKNISYCPHSDRIGGYRKQSRRDAERLHALLSDFSRVATSWLASVLPRYAEGWKIDQVSYRPEEEATRKLRQTARNDLLHVDAFPSRPTNGHRILRLFVNVNPTDPRVWVTSDNFARLLERFGKEVGLPTSDRPSWNSWLKGEIVRLFRPGRNPRSAYDDFMLRFHNFLKANDHFQERCFKRFWNFQPGATWLVLTDTCSHAVLRGRFALENSYFIAPATLALPDESPSALLASAAGMPVLHRAAA
jgi:hypothetical protein